MSAPLPPLSIEIRSRRYPAAQRAIMRGLHKYNDEKVGDWPFRRIVVAVRTKRGAVKGGLFGKIYWGWLFVEYFWLDGKLRGRDWGTKCLASAEAEAARLLGRMVGHRKLPSPGILPQAGLSPIRQTGCPSARL